MSTSRCTRLVARLIAGFSAIWLAVTTPQAKVLDNFNDNVKTDWSDFTFQTGFGLPTESNGQFRFELPPAGQAIFTASQKKSETFELKEGRTVEFRADVIQTGGKDSFAVLAFIPTAPSPVNGFFFFVRKCDTIELNMNVDSALKYIISMGVVAPAPPLHPLANNPAGRAQNE